MKKINHKRNRIGKKIREWKEKNLKRKGKNGKH